MKKAAQMQAGGKENEDGGGAKADQVQENEDGGGAKADQVQGKARESAASFMNEEHESQLRMKAKRRDETGASTSREFEAVLGGCFGSTETNEIEPEPLNLDSRTAFSPKKVSRLTGETSSPDKLKQDEPYSPYSPWKCS